MARRAYLDHLRIDAASGFASWLCFLVSVRSERAPVTADTHQLLRTVRPFGVDAAVMLLGRAGK